MNGVASASVSAGSSQREAIVTCRPQVTVPSGAATAVAGIADTIAMRPISETPRDMRPKDSRNHLPLAGLASSPVATPLDGAFVVVSWAGRNPPVLPGERMSHDEPEIVI